MPVGLIIGALGGLFLGSKGRVSQVGTAVKWAVIGGVAFVAAKKLKVI